MQLEKVYQAIMNGRAILITGSGAHGDVLTPDGKPFPSGIELAKTIYASCGIMNPENIWDIQDAADTFLEKKSADKLIVELKKMLLIGQIRQKHKDLYAQPWQRVYTTNYDDVPLMATKECDRTLLPVTLNSCLKKDWEDTRYCVYINGYIGNLNETTLKSEFRLSGKSYTASDVLHNSDWGALFSEDIETADCIVIVGLSLDYDLDIKRFIHNQNAIDKIVFIEKRGISDDKIRKLNRLGMVYPIGMEDFTRKLMEYKKEHITEIPLPNTYIYKSFEINRKKSTFQKATSFQVYDFFMIGKYYDTLWHRENGKYVNLVYRKALHDVIDALNAECRVIYLHANLGNGKTVFIECLKHQLERSNYQIYLLKEYYEGITAKEIRQIASIPGKKIVIIENYYNYINVLKKIALYPLNDFQFILTARTVLYDTRITEANECLKVKENQSVIIDLNKLTYPEVNAMSNILSTNGLWGTWSNLSAAEKKRHLRSRNSGNAEFQGILVDVLQSDNMRNKIETIVAHIKKVSDSYYEVLILALLIKIMSLNLSANDMSKIMEISIALDADFVHNENVLEILDFSNGQTEFKIRSAVTANLILKELDCNETIIKVLVQTAKFADKYHRLERYENVLKNIISYSHVKTFLLKSGQKEIFLIKYYDSLKELKYYEKNTFFWLQYAIACSNIGNYTLAQRYLDSAYSFFEDSEYTVPFQVDTQQARLYFLQIENDSTIEPTELFRKAHTLLMQPVVSDKDNEEKQLLLLNNYVKKNIRNKLPDSFSDTYHKFCGEAYNKVSQYTKKVNAKASRSDFENLKEKLLRASV